MREDLRKKGAANLQRSRAAIRWSGASTLRSARSTATRREMNDDYALRVRTAVARLPDWLRRDLASKDEVARQRAEESLAAMILSATAEPIAD